MRSDASPQTGTLNIFVHELSLASKYQLKNDKFLADVSVQICKEKLLTAMLLY